MSRLFHLFREHFRDAEQFLEQRSLPAIRFLVYPVVQFGIDVPVPGNGVGYAADTGHSVDGRSVVMFARSLKPYIAARLIDYSFDFYKSIHMPFSRVFNYQQADIAVRGRVAIGIGAI